MKPAAWILLAFLTFLNVLNYVDRQLIPSLAPKLMAGLGLSRAEIGLQDDEHVIVFTGKRGAHSLVPLRG